MLHRGLLLALAFAFTALAADHRRTGSCDQVFTVPFDAGRALEMDLRSGDIEVAGTPEPEVRVVCRLDERGTERDVRIAFEQDTLRISDGPNRGVHIRIYIPHKTNLRVECPAGNLTLTDVEGDKDVRLRAGNLTIKGARAADYSRFDASVTAGNVNAPHFGDHKGGLFRSLRKSNSAGRYTLNARVWAGNIEVH